MTFTPLYILVKGNIQTKMKNSTEEGVVLQGKTNLMILMIFPSAKVRAGIVG